MLILALMLACANPADNKSAAEVVPAAPPAAAAPAAPVTPPPAAVPAGPEVAVTGTVGFIGSKVTASHEGAFSTWNGGVVLAEGKVSAFRFEVDVATLKTDSEKLDGHLKSPDFFDVGQFPKATFVSKSLTEGAPADSKLAGANMTIEGDLTLRGVTKTVRFPAVVTVTGATVAAQTEFVISRKDFGIVYPGKPDDLIRDEVVLKINVKTGA
jgi:polyisoprenoid-binding protein YceI